MFLRFSMLLMALVLLLTLVVSEPGAVDTLYLKHIANVSYAEDNINPSGSASIFSPRMDFEQWKPLTGRGDPLRNDPTYDYEPPVLDRVHYWADETRLEREHYPERKSEVLMLGVSSRKPSVAPRQPPPPRRHPRPPHPKYEEFAYKLSEHYPMTILVPPPLPPRGHQPPLFVLPNEKPPMNSHTKSTEPTVLIPETTTSPGYLSSLYALQEGNLVYQSSTTSQSWIFESNDTKSLLNNAVSSDYAGWGPTTPIEDNDVNNDTHNFISHDQIEQFQQPYSFYKPMLSEAPSPSKATPTFQTFVPPTATAPSTVTSQSLTASVNYVTRPTEKTTVEISTDTAEYYDEITTEKPTTYNFLPTPNPGLVPKPEKNILDMLSSMMTMPMVNGPERPEDNLYAHASENLHVFKEQETEDAIKLESMQTMQPPPIIKSPESTTIPQNRPFHVNSHILNNVPHNKGQTHDPYLNMRFTTPLSTITSEVDSIDNTKSTTASIVPMYLIIQGHSKVKTYSSKPKLTEDNDTISNEVSKPNETKEVKHLHPIKEKYVKKPEIDFNRISRSQRLKSLVESGLGSIELQETDLGVKYDVSDGSEVPIEIYRKGIVDSDEYDYSSKKNDKNKRVKRQIGIEDLIPFDEDTLEEYVFNYLKAKRNETGITGILAQAVTSDEAAAVDDLEDDDDDDDFEDEDR